MRRLTFVVMVLAMCGCSGGGTSASSENAGKIEGTTWRSIVVSPEWDWLLRNRYGDQKFSFQPDGRFRWDVSPMPKPGEMVDRPKDPSELPGIMPATIYTGKYVLSDGKGIDLVFDGSGGYKGKTKQTIQVALTGSYEMTFTEIDGTTTKFVRWCSPAPPLSEAQTKRGAAVRRREFAAPAKAAGPTNYVEIIHGDGFDERTSAAADGVWARRTTKDGREVLLVRANVWDLEFGAPAGEKIGVKQYLGAGKPTDKQYPSLVVQGMRPSTGDSVGMFQIWEFKTDAAGEVTELSIDFVQGRVSGMIRKNSTLE
jgi:hypothetical protein